MGDRDSALPHIDALDGARGLAVAGVLLFHGGHLLGGYLGVDFFFTLSGFLITSLLLGAATRDGRIGLGGFWARRARRLLPALVVLMLGIALYCLLIASPEQLQQVRGDAFATLGYVANWHEIFAGHNYFALFTAPSPLNHTWSLAIEEQFYVAWPLVVVGLLAWSKRGIASTVLWTSLLLAAISSVLMVVFYDPTNVSRSYFGTDTRAAAILFGAALAAWLTGHGPVRRGAPRIALEIVAGLGVVVLAIAWTRLDGTSSTLFHGGFLVCGLAATAVIAAAIHPTRGPVSRVLSFRPLCGLGLISYGVYLYHWPIDVAFDAKRMGFNGWPLFAFQTTVTILIAIGSYRLVEQPIRRGAGSSVQWRKLIPAGAIGLVAILAVSTIGARPARKVDPLRDRLRAATQAFDSAPPNAKRVMVVGDSVAYSLGVGMQHLVVSPPVASFNGAVQGCVFPDAVTRIRHKNAEGHTFTFNTYSCDLSWQAGAIDRFRPAIILWIVDNPAAAVVAGGQWMKTCSDPFAALYERAIRAELAKFEAHGAKVVMTTLAYPRYLFANDDPATDCYNAVHRKVAAATGTQLVDLNAFICPGGVCRTQENGIVLRADGEHYDGAGGRLVARWILEQIS
ncbi:MAG TPA: acyltransferase family protein [Acidimicrobiia bacterium]|nr:acyltransferase family protein [Acidimicrobiia bacterium]